MGSIRTDSANKTIEFRSKEELVEEQGVLNVCWIIDTKEFKLCGGGMPLLEQQKNESS